MATRSKQEPQPDCGELLENDTPLFIKDLAVGYHGGSLKHTIPNEAARLLGLTGDEKVRVAIFKNGYFVFNSGGDDE